MVEFHGGRKPPILSKPRLKFSQFKATDYNPPPYTDYLSRVNNWPMYLNDRIGDCTIAAAAHMVQSWTNYGQGNQFNMTDSDVLNGYRAVSGYDPQTGANDDGAVMQEVLDYWRKNGIGTRKILAFAEVDIHDKIECYQATDVFGALYLGINFPQSAMDQFNRSLPWDVAPGSQIEGGHAIHAGWYDASRNIWKIITWGRVQDMTQAFFDTYVEEAWVVITDDFIDPTTGKTPKGIDRYALGEAFSQLTGEANPFPAPPPAPQPAPQNLGEVLEVALRKFLKNKNVPAYLRKAATSWMEDRDANSEGSAKGN